MSRLPATVTSHRVLTIAVAGGCLYAAGIFLWAFTTGVSFSSNDPVAVLSAGGFAVLGMFLIAALPLYLLGRFSLLTPLLVAAWSLGNLVYLRWYVPRPHDALASYLVIWPLFVFFITGAALLEGGLRLGTDRVTGRLGLRRLL